MPEPSNPGQIDVRLLGGSEITSLQAAIKEMAASVNTFKQGSAELRVIAEQQMVQQPRPAPGASTAEGSVSFGGAGQPSAGASQGRVTLQQTLEDRDLRQRAAQSQDAATEALAAATAAPGRPQMPTTEEIFQPKGFIQRQLARTLPDTYERDVARAKGLTGGVSSGASTGGRGSNLLSGMPSPGSAGDIDPNAEIWQHQAQELGLSGRIEMPQYGELTAQNKIFMAAQGLQRVAQMRQRNLGEGDTSTFAQTTGTAAAAIGRASTWLPAVSLAGGYALGNRAGGQGLLGVNIRPSIGIDQYERAGVSQAGGTLQDVPLLGGIAERLGVNARLPTWMRALPPPIANLIGADTPAGKAYWDDLPDRIKARASTVGISDQEAQGIEEFMTASGRRGRGDRGLNQRRAAYEFFGRGGGGNVMDFGMGSEFFKQAARQAELGNDNMRDFLVTMKELPQAAKDAHLGIDEFGQQLTQLVEQFQTIGGTQQGARRAGIDWTKATGTQPGTLGSLLENPYVSGMISANTGLLPQVIGALPQGQRTAEMYRAAKLIEGGFSGIGPQTQQIKGPNGEVLGEYDVTARAQREALAAQTLGIPLNEYRIMMHNQRRATAVAPLQSGLEMLRRGVSQTAPGSAGRRRLASDTTDNSIFSAREMTTYMGKHGIGSASERGHLRDLADHGQWKKYDQMSRRLINDYTKYEKDQQGQSGNVQVDLTDRAAKLLKITKPSQKAADRTRNKSKQNKGAAPDWVGSEPDYPAVPGHAGWESAGYQSGIPSN